MQKDIPPAGRCFNTYSERLQLCIYLLLARLSGLALMLLNIDFSSDNGSIKELENAKWESRERETNKVTLMSISAVAVNQGINAVEKGL